MEIEKINYSTFYTSKENGEKNSYSAYIPNEKKGFWIIMSDENEIDNKKCKKIVCEIVEKYSENSSFTMENMSSIINYGNKKFIEEKIKNNKDYDVDFSIMAIMLEKNEVIVGNIGNCQLRQIRKGEIIEEIIENKIKMLNLEKEDKLIFGNKNFWEIIDNEMLNINKEILNNGFLLENNIKTIINKIEKNMNEDISFMSIFVNNCEINKKEYKKIKKGKEIKIKSFLLFLICFLFLFLGYKSFTNILSKNENNKKKVKIIAKTEKINKISESQINEIINNNIERQENIKSEKSEEINKKIDENKNNIEEIVKIDEKIDTLENKIIKNKNIKRVKINENREKIVNIYAEKEVNHIKTLEEEINDNWKILGRDKNGQKIENIEENSEK